MKIITNNQPRFIIDPWEMNEKQRKEFDYINWDDADMGKTSPLFFKYKGQLYDLGEFMRTDIEGWDGVAGDTYFSGVLVKFDNQEDLDTVIVGRYYS